MSTVPPTAAPGRRFAFLFVCQGGELEIKALLLAASLRRHLAVPYELVAGIPGPADRWPAPARRTLDLLAAWNIRTAPIVNAVDARDGLANKIACLQVPTEADKRFFLDSDLLCLRPFTDHPRFARPCHAKPVDLLTSCEPPAVWQQLRAAVGLSGPEPALETTVSGDPCPPYFNSGVIGLDRDLPLGRAWADCARRIEGRLANPYFREQVAFALAVQQLGLDVDVLDDSFNYPAHLQPVRPAQPPLFCHYHSPAVLRREPVLLAAVRQLVDDTPALADALAGHPDWAGLLRPRARRPGWRRLLPPPRDPPPGAPLRIPELVITGIPRSGTSYLCRLLHRYDDCVVINEPVEAVTTLQEARRPWPLAVYYRETRRRILDGQPVKNKLADREVQEDTARGDVRSLYRPLVRTTEFVLGVKNPQSFLARLAELRRVLPDARIVACVRNPYDAIASWKKTFPHLRDADVTGIPVGGAHDPYLPESARARLREIAAVSDVAERRARLWALLAESILERRDDLILVRYEDLVRDPARHVADILGPWSAGRLRQPLHPSTIRRGRGGLDAADRAAIEQYCLPAARELGLDVVPPA